jgi:hypothetical protein
LSAAGLDLSAAGLDFDGALGLAAGVGVTALATSARIKVVMSAANIFVNFMLGPFSGLENGDFFR